MPWTTLHIRERNKGDYTAVSFRLAELSAECDIEPTKFERFMSGFSASKVVNEDVSAYVTGLVPDVIRKRLRILARAGRVYLGLNIEGDSPSKLAYPIHTIPWEAVSVGAKTWRTAYSAVRIHDRIAQGRTISGDVSMGIFCCEYTPFLTTRKALRETYADLPVKLGRMYEVTPKTAAADFMSLQKHPAFYASCHGIVTTQDYVNFLSPNGDCFLTTNPDDAGKNYRALIADPAPAIVCFDSCFSAYDPSLAKFMLDRGCNVFIGNLFEAEQDGTNAGTPTAREILRALLWSDQDGRHGLCDSVLLGVKAAGAKHRYNTVVYVNSSCAPDRDAFGNAAVLVNIKQWLVWLLAVVSLLAGLALGEAWLFRVIADGTPILLRILWEVFVGAVLFSGARLLLPFQQK
ncbi:MAG: hypothetical protein LBU86_04425 [Oscillospiraceae bacterium]|jgi:hypothetical protein|nr:hypothetical protein [Oscillospiraceae bacterium]